MSKVLDGQTSLDLFDKRDPFNCEYTVAVRQDGRVLCYLHGTDEYGDMSKCVITNCRDSVAGDPPRCVYEPHDNSPEAMARRRKWFEEHGRNK